MPAQRLDGRQLAAQLEEVMAAAIASGLQQAGRPPGLAVLRVGEDPASGVYVANKEKPAPAWVWPAMAPTWLPPPPRLRLRPSCGS